MRSQPSLLLSAALALASCSDGTEPQERPYVTGFWVAVTTSGLDIDSDGYRLEVDGADLVALPANDTLLIHVSPGLRTVSLAGLAPNCVHTGTSSFDVTVLDAEASSRIDFAVSCTAVTGVVKVTVAAKGRGKLGPYVVMMDGRRVFTVRYGLAAYLHGVPAGDHTVSLKAPMNCAIEAVSQTVTVSAGGMIRDTVETTFPVLCVARDGFNLWITAPTTGPLPTHDYEAWICPASSYDCRYGGGGIGSTRIGTVKPNGILGARVPVRVRQLLFLRNIPRRCTVNGPNPAHDFTPPLAVSFPVVCT